MNEVVNAQLDDHDIHGGKRRIESAIDHLSRSAQEGAIEKGTGRLRRMHPQDCRSVVRFADVLIGQNISELRVAKCIIVLQDLLVRGHTSFGTNAPIHSGIKKSCLKRSDRKNLLT
jgi:hypothetical protein